MLDIRLSVGGVAVPVGYAGLEWLPYIIPDTPGYEGACRHLAEHGGAKARYDMASRENIDTQTIRMLFQSGDVNARRALLANKRAHQTLIQEEILQVLEMDDPDLLEVLICNVTEYVFCDPRPIFERLHVHPDPWVRGLIADCADTPAPVLDALSRDADPDVARKANATIENRSESDDLLLSEENE